MSNLLLQYRSCYNLTHYARKEAWAQAAHLIEVDQSEESHSEEEDRETPCAERQEASDQGQRQKGQSGYW